MCLCNVNHYLCIAVISQVYEREKPSHRHMHIQRMFTSDLLAKTLTKKIEMHSNGTVCIYRKQMNSKHILFKFKKIEI